MRREGVGFIANLDLEQRLRYYWWWRKYLVLKYVSRTALVVSFATLLAPFAEKPLQPIIWATAKPALCVAVVAGIWWACLECPRCGERYRWGGDADYFGDDCQNCGLASSQLSSIAKPRR
jgi:hypothetical protein